MSDENKCLDCNAPLIPCTCRPDCPGGMCSSMECPWCLNSPLSKMRPDELRQYYANRAKEPTP